jgi:hypothetical protein
MTKSSKLHGALRTAAELLSGKWGPCTTCGHWRTPPALPSACTLTYGCAISRIEFRPCPYFPDPDAELRARREARERK